jgi:hypothetical protein
MMVMVFGQLVTLFAFPVSVRAAGEIEIVSWEDLADISGDLDGDYILMNDLGPLDVGYDTYASSTANGGLGWTPLGSSGTPFTGTFDGQGYSITGLTIITTSSGIGLFGEVSGATIRDVELIDVDIAVDSGAQYVGALAGRVSGSTVENVQTSGTISGFGHYVGGIIGQVFDSDPEASSVLADSSSTVAIENSGSTTGGAVGYLDAQNLSTTIRNTHVSGDVTANYNVGGLVGYMQWGTIRESSAEGDASAFDADGFRIGGLVGDMDTGSFVFNSYATGDVSGQTDIGGLIGRSYYGIVANTFSLGLVTATGGGSDIGGFIGETDTPASYSVTGSFWNGDGSNNGLDAIDDGNQGVGVSGLDDGEAANEERFTDMGWDFDNVWEMGGAHPEIRSNVTYFEGAGTEEDPYLVGESCAQLSNIRFFPSAHYKLTQNMDCSETVDWHSGSGFMGLSLPYDGHKFTGIFDGDNHTISGVMMNTPDDDYTGLFRYIGNGSSVFDLTIEDANITGNNAVGVLAGGLEGTATNVVVSGVVHGHNNVGGLVGIHADGYGLSNSSPLVYSWDGDSYEYVADVGEMIARGTDGEDYTVIDADKIAPKGDVYSMHISQEYNEIVYYDALSLLRFEHEPGYAVVEPMLRNAGLDSLTTVSDMPTHELQACTDMYGNDCLEELKAYDDQWSYKDESDVNEWILDFGDLSQAERVQLVLRAARDYEATPDYDHRTVSVMGPDGQWVQIYGRKELGSDGTPRLRTIDLTGKFLTDDYRVKFGFDRLRVNYIAVDTSAEQSFTMDEVAPSKAELSFRGYTAIDKTYFNDHDFNTVSGMPPAVFAEQVGNFTKYGNILPLLENAEDQFVVMRHGDSMEIEFPYNDTLTPGKERSYMLFSDVVYKHASEETGRTVDPLPYSGMTPYPAYGYPMTDSNEAYLREWNTRTYYGLTSNSSTIIDSSADVDVIGTDSNIGGLVGYNTKLITGSFATGYVYGASINIGGLVGSNEGGTILESYAANELAGEGVFEFGEAPVEGGCYVGGLVGYVSADSVITDTYSMSDAYTDSCTVGGFAGGIAASDVTNSYSLGQAKAGVGEITVGGFVGTILSGTLVNVFWNSDVNPGLQTCGYEDGYDCDVEQAGSGKTAEALQNISTFTDDLGESAWDFEEIWGINANEHDGYPFLRWQGFTHFLGLDEEPVVERVRKSSRRRSTTSRSDTSSDSRTSSNDIVETITSLITQNNTSSTQTNTNTTSTNTTTSARNLQFGMTGDDVQSLQALLIGLQYQIPAGPTGYFGAQTQSALSKYQSASGISPAIGFFGPVTRAQMKNAGLTGLWW